MGDSPALKKPKLEKDDYDSAYWPRPSSNGPAPKPPASAAGPEEEEEDIAEEAVLALIAHRERDVERCKLKLLHYQSLVRPRLFPSRLPPLVFGDDKVAILVGF